MSFNFLLVICAVVCIASSLEAASLGKAQKANGKAVQAKLDYETVNQNVRSARQAYEDDSGEDSDEDDDEADAEVQHQNAIRQQQAHEQTVDDSQEGSNEDDEDEEDGYFGRRMKRDVMADVGANEIEENSKPNKSEEEKQKPVTEDSESGAAPSAASTTSASPNTSVLILIRDTIKKVTELPNTQQVATSAQQYFQLFEHFLQQTIEQVIGDDDDEDEIESTTIANESAVELEVEKESETATNKPEELAETADKESSVQESQMQAEKTHEESNEIKA